jgi:hypothetical protein
MILKKKQLQERLRVKRLRRDSEIVDGAKEAYDDDDATEEKDEGRKIDNVSPMIMLMMIGYDNDNDDDDYDNDNDSDI